MIRTKENPGSRGIKFPSGSKRGIRRMSMTMAAVLVAVLLGGNAAATEALAGESEATATIEAGTMPEPSYPVAYAYVPSYSDNPVIAEVERNLEVANPSFVVEGAAAWHDEVWNALGRNCLQTYREHNTGSVKTVTSGTDMSFTVGYYCTAEEQAVLDACIDLTIPMLTGQTTYETVKNVHDHVCMLADYWYEDDGTMTRYDPFSIIVYGKGVCNAYALLFQRYMERMGIPCYIARGRANGGPHAWNIVMVDGQWYHIDCTWDGQDPETRHTYFLLGADKTGYTTWGYAGMTQVTLAATSYGE